jgi:hypothetical protein
MMHGLTNLKFINTKQAGDTYSYKNMKQKLHKTIAASGLTRHTSHLFLTVNLQYNISYENR